MLDSVMVFLSTVGNNGMLWIVLGLLLLVNKSWRKAGVFTLLTILVAGITQDLLKEWFARPRPIVDAASLLVEMPTSYAFPSGHTMVAFSAAATIYVFMPRTGIVALFVAFFVGISRIYLGVHYISDVIFGALFGLGLSYGLIRLKNWSSIRRPRAEDA